MKGDNFLELQVFSFDLNPSNLIPDLDLRNLVVDAKAQKIYKEFRRDLLEKANNGTCEFILEPLVSKKKVIFRIVDTIFKKN